MIGHDSMLVLSDEEIENISIIINKPPKYKKTKWIIPNPIDFKLLPNKNISQITWPKK